MKAVFSFAILVFSFSISKAQLLNKKEVLTKADTLRGSNGPGRDWWDATKYDLHVRFNLRDSTISGWNEIQLKYLKDGDFMQIDLQASLAIDSITVRKQMPGKKGELVYAYQKFKGTLERNGNAYFLKPQAGKINGNYFRVYYHGKPAIARNPPWDGGLIWKKDKNKNPFISIACQGLGASVWYPCKDIQSDEPDSAEMHITIPAGLECVGNGRFRGKTVNKDGTATFDWAVESPINNYNLVPYIGKYAHFSEVYKGETGDLDMDYWVLDYNLEKAKEQFKQAPLMMNAFEYWFGPYPFYKDGYKLVEAPHLGMEHQSATAYGNYYQNGYLGNDLSGSGWGSKWDYIIIHESGHEWFANNITTKDIADMWVHEGFTSYSEALFTDYHYGKEAGNEYAIGLRKNIRNDKPIIGVYGVNKEGSSDMYPKGASMLHTIRQVMNDDSLFRKILRGLNRDFYHQTVTTKQIEDYFCKESNIDFSKVFDQYLRNASIPTLEYKIEGRQLQYRYIDCITGFNMPVKANGRWLKPTDQWQSTKVPGGADFIVDPNFYINTKKTE